MSPTNLLRLSATRSTTRVLRPRTSAALPSRLGYQARFSGSDYGTPGPADPQPKDRPNPSADKEHPGPPPPKPGQGTGSTGTKAGEEGHNTPSPSEQKKSSNSSSSSSSSSGKRGYHTTRTLRNADEKSAETGDAGNKNSASNGAEPKILDHKAPAQGESQSEDVKRHNREFEERGDRSANSINDKGEAVSKEFWREDKDSRRKE